MNAKLILLCSLAVPIAAAAQTRIDPRLIRKSPQIDISKTPLQTLLRERREVYDIPADMVQLGNPPGGWSFHQIVKTVGTALPKSALRVEYRRTYTPKQCESWYDRVDLKRMRARGFRLVGYSAEPLDLPGYPIRKPLEAIAVNSRVDANQYTSNLTTADQIRIRPPTMAYEPGGPPGGPGTFVCYSGYRLSITVEGPKNLDPLAP
ncbi:hypothetical protein ACVWZA_001387 [Sphingomonas sp. UYAg733]